jgi:hypothetical protein
MPRYDPAEALQLGGQQGHIKEAGTTGNHVTGHTVSHLQ